MLSKETINAMALSMMFANKPAQLKQVYEHAGSATAIVDNASQLRDIMPELNISAFGLDIEHLKTCIEAANKEAEYLEEHDLQCISMSDEAYPERMKEVCNDAPLVLYFCGNANLNSKHILSIVGTRNSTEYGRDMVDKICSELAYAYPDLLVVSGLAYGTDINAHRASLNNNLPTVGVLAHGLDRIYPSVHRNTAAKMIKNGGLLTEYPIGTSPERYNFLRRNRLIASLAEATLVVESKVKGGALSTAYLAEDYGLMVLACPGRATDEMSVGCNNLIASNHAALVTSGADIVKALNWEVPKSKVAPLPSLFDIDLTGEERIVYNCLDTEGVHINHIVESSGMPINTVVSILSELEFREVVRLLPGSKWRKLQ